MWNPLLHESLEFTFFFFEHLVGLQWMGGVCFTFLCTLSHQNVFSSYKHSHCHKQTNSSVVAFHIWKWLILPSSWQSIKHLCFLTVALAPILVIQPFSFYFSFQNSLCCDSFHPSWTQKYSYHFRLLKKKINHLSPI